MAKIVLKNNIQIEICEDGVELSGPGYSLFDIKSFSKFTKNDITENLNERIPFAQQYDYSDVTEQDWLDAENQEVSNSDKMLILAKVKAIA